VDFLNIATFYQCLPLESMLSQRFMMDVYLAPMVGLTHLALRKVVAQYVPEGQSMLWPTEMLSSWRIPKEVLGSSFETLKGPEETHICPQILGNEEEPIRISVQKLEDWGATAIDINMGCPVTKALRHNYGVALMGDLDYAARVVEVTVKSTKLPVSVKLRAGLQNDLEYLLRFVKALENAGAAWITLHPRVAGLKRRGRADWSQIQKVKAHLSIPVIGNGDVESVGDYLRMKSETGCDGVMIGRALAAKPWLVEQIARSEDLPRDPYWEGAEYGRNLMLLIQYLEEADLSYESLQKKLSFYVRMTHMWLDFGHQLNSISTKSKNLEELREGVFKFFESPQRMAVNSALKG